MDQTPAPRHASVALVDTAVGSVDPANLSTPGLESRLGRLAARIAAAECELLVLLAEFDARQGWGECGMRSAAHWLSWRTGLRLGVARERVRVARTLRHLPVVRAAFADLLTEAANPAEGVPAETPAADDTVAPVIDGEPVEQRSADRLPPAATLPDGQKLSPSTVLRLLCHSPARLMVHARDGAGGSRSTGPGASASRVRRPIRPTATRSRPRTPPPTPSPRPGAPTRSTSTTSSVAWPATCSWPATA